MYGITLPSNEIKIVEKQEIIFCSLIEEYNMLQTG
jgi:hypothetical protein